MKSYKIFIESITEPKYDEDHKYELVQNLIIKDNKIINGFKVDFDNMAGTIDWSNGEYLIYATPYWEGYKKLPINIENNSGEEINQNFFNLREIKNINDVNLAIKYYYKIIEKVTNELNKRSELKKDLELILKTTEIKIETSIKGEYIRNIHSINQIDIDKIPITDVIKLLNIINNKYYDIILANKFNI